MDFKELASFLRTNDVVLALIILSSSIIFARLLRSVVNGVLRRLTRKTETTLDDHFFEAIDLPLQAGVIILGLLGAAGVLNFLDPYKWIIKSIGIVVGAFWGVWVLIRIVNGIFKWYESHAV